MLVLAGSQLVHEAAQMERAKGSEQSPRAASTAHEVMCDSFAAPAAAMTSAGEASVHGEDEGSTLTFAARAAFVLPVHRCLSLSLIHI